MDNCIISNGELDQFNFESHREDLGAFLLSDDG